MTSDMGRGETDRGGTVVTRDTTGATGGGMTGGGATAPVATAPATRETAWVGERRSEVGRDRVRWGPIIAGLLTALATFLLLSLLAVAIGAQTVAGGQAQADPGAAGTASAITTAIIGLLSFFVGGFVAGRTAGVRNRADGALNGFLVWALVIPLTLILAGLGLGAVLGAAGDVFGQYRTLGGGTGGANVDPARVAEGIRNSALGGFLGMVLPAIAAAVGGFLGARDDGDGDRAYRTEAV